MGTVTGITISTYSPLFLHLFHLFFLSLYPVLSLSAQIEAPFIGVTIGTSVSNLLSPTDLVSFLKSQQITHVRLYDADTSLLSALANTGIKVLVGVPNNELIALGSSPATASAWVTRRLAPFIPSTQISGIAVGDEVPNSLPSALPVLLPALQSLRNAVLSNNLSIPVSTPLPFSLIQDPFPPSQSFFNNSLTQSFIVPLLGFLSNTSSPLMVNLYPYYAFMQSKGVVPLDNALFKPLPPSLEMVDTNTLLHYTNVYDAMVDAVHFSMKNLNFTGISVLVTETGWPSYGDHSVEPYATKDNADTYNSNLIKHVLEHTGTPSHPEFTSSLYVYELFDEDLNPGPISEANWGLFYGNGTPVYLLHVSGTGGFLANDTTNRTFCVASDDADIKAVQAALDWACGPGRANCSEIQPGESCYEPNDVRSHASYSFNNYYQMQGRGSGSCYFQGAGMVTTSDPSHGSCVFSGSKRQSNLSSNGSSANQTTSNDGSNIFRFRRGEENYAKQFLYLILSLLMTFSITNSNFWT
ncbi:O-Glycosyl hydrolases family 17 protein [Carex rostrata]